MSSINCCALLPFITVLLASAFSGKCLMCLHTSERLTLPQRKWSKDKKLNRHPCYSSAAASHRTRVRCADARGKFDIILCVRMCLVGLGSRGQQFTRRLLQWSLCSVGLLPLLLRQDCHKLEIRSICNSATGEGRRDFRRAHSATGNQEPFPAPFPSRWTISFNMFQGREQEGTGYR